MVPRFFVPDLASAGDVARLPAGEAHHLVRVLRLGPGDRVQVFDGHGVEWRAQVKSADRSGATVALLEPLEPRRPSVDLTLVQAVLKGEAMDEVVRDCTMVGVASIRPVLTAHCTVKASTMAAAPERWRRIALAAAKQCGAARLPEIGSVVAFDDHLGRGPFQSAFILVEPSVASVPLRIRQLASRPVPPEAVLFVGPEGGWTEDERDRAVAAGCAPLSLGALTLRADAVPLVAAAALLGVWDE